MSPRSRNAPTRPRGLCRPWRWPRFISAPCNLGTVAEEIATPAGKPETHVVEGARVEDLICATARQLRADLIVMGTHGRTGPARVFLGSVAERTIRHAPCPVLAVPASAHAASS